MRLLPVRVYFSCNIEWKFLSFSFFKRKTYLQFPRLSKSSLDYLYISLRSLDLHNAREANLHLPSPFFPWGLPPFPPPPTKLRSSASRSSSFPKSSNPPSGVRSSRSPIWDPNTRRTVELWNLIHSTTTKQTSSSAHWTVLIMLFCELRKLAG